LRSFYRTLFNGVVAQINAADFRVVAQILWPAFRKIFHLLGCTRSLRSRSLERCVVIRTPMRLCKITNDLLESFTVRGSMPENGSSSKTNEAAASANAQFSRRRRLHQKACTLTGSNGFETHLHKQLFQTVTLLLWSERESFQYRRDSQCR